MLSSNYLYHFTDFESLKSILSSSSFHVNFSLEDFSWLKPEEIIDPNKTMQDEKKENHKFAIPLVSFCDIPPALVEEHARMYGKNGIAFKPEFKTKYALSPLFYINKKTSVSTLLTALNVQAGRIIDDCQRCTIENLVKKLLLNCKPYEGYYKRNGIEDQEYRFYDEREWRYIPPGDLVPILQEENLLKIKDRKYCELRFQHKDVLHLITEDENKKKILKNMFPKLGVKLYNDFIKIDE